MAEEKLTEAVQKRREYEELWLDGEISKLFSSVDGLDWFQEHFGAYDGKAHTIYDDESDAILRRYLSKRERRAFDFLRTDDSMIGSYSNLSFYSYIALGTTALLRLRELLCADEGRTDTPPWEVPEAVFFDEDMDEISEDTALRMVEEKIAAA